MKFGKKRLNSREASIHEFDIVFVFGSFTHAGYFKARFNFDFVTTRRPDRKYWELASCDEYNCVRTGFSLIFRRSRLDDKLDNPQEHDFNINKIDSEKRCFTSTIGF